MDSVPIEITQLGLGIDDYVAIAKNVQRMIDISGDARQGILDSANSELSDEVTVIARQLPSRMANDREFFREAGLPYGPGIPVQGCFISAVADYLLRNQHKINF